MGSLVSDDEVWAQTAIGCYKGQIYGMGTSYSRSYSLGSIFGAGSARTNPEAIND